MVSSIVPNLTICPLSILGLEVGYDDYGEPSIEPEQVLQAAEKVAEIRPSQAHCLIHEEALINYRILGERAVSIINKHGPFVQDDDYPSILHVILERERRERLLDPERSEPLALFDSPAHESKFVVCHVCWAVIYRTDVEGHMVNEHTGYCMICEQHIQAQDKGLLDHMKNQHQYCSLCLGIQDIGEYYEHLKTDHLSQCRVCHIQFKSHKLVSQHLREQHEWDIYLHDDKELGGPPKTETCPLERCAMKIFPDGLRQHIFGEGKARHALKPCLHCPTAQRINVLSEHLTRYHSWFCCERRHMDPTEYDVHRWIEHAVHGENTTLDEVTAERDSGKETGGE
ncbi:hypothetical protein LEL_10716 [Akanthomyces lecanii RCEF 1005]|uniref:C2H2-type domain-containing protein n=1 Tax=Akanthomyces lecanii RCEF 1005 TaxID=1081108 RepID=A0A167V9Q5_CORDF|nr:hypothetical protein LEL_10716 [Akanthomyces lecanii RCEF 1005]